MGQKLQTRERNLTKFIEWCDFYCDTDQVSSLSGNHNWIYQARPSSDYKEIRSALYFSDEKISQESQKIWITIFLHKTFN